MRRTLVVALVSLIFIIAWMPAAAAAPTSAEIEQKKEAIKERDKEILQIEKEKKLNLEEKRRVMERLDEMKSRLTVLNEEVYRTEQELKRSEKRLRDLTYRIEAREFLLKQRLRTLYQRGEMYYFESLFESDSFGEFLFRLDAVRQVMRADRKLIDAHKRDKRQAEAEKASIERDLKERRRLAAEAKQLHKKLVDEYKRYEAQLADLEKRQADLEELNERERQEIRRLIAQKAQEEARREAAEQGAVAGDGEFLWPVKGGRLTSGYGYRKNPVTGAYKLHEGIDIAAPLGTPIRAAAEGKVIESRPAGGYGYIVVIHHGNGLSTLYAHVYPQDVTVRVGQSVRRGQIIAAVGNNGRSTGPHLHLEVLKEGRAVDPMAYFR